MMGAGRLPAAATPSAGPGVLPKKAASRRAHAGGDEALRGMAPALEESEEAGRLKGFAHICSPAIQGLRPGRRSASTVLRRCRHPKGDIRRWWSSLTPDNTHQYVVPRSQWRAFTTARGGGRALGWRQNGGGGVVPPAEGRAGWAVSLHHPGKIITVSDFGSAQ